MFEKLIGIIELGLVEIENNRMTKKELKNRIKNKLEESIFIINTEDLPTFETDSIDGEMYVEKSPILSLTNEIKKEIDKTFVYN